MKLIVPMLLAAFLSLGFAGCSEKSSVTTEKKISTPQGTTTIESTTEVKKTGSNPPPAN